MDLGLIIVQSLSYKFYYIYKNIETIASDDSARNLNITLMELLLIIYLCIFSKIKMK